MLIISIVNWFLFLLLLSVRTLYYMFCKSVQLFAEEINAHSHTQRENHRVHCHRRATTWTGCFRIHSLFRIRFYFRFCYFINSNLVTVRFRFTLFAKKSRFHSRWCVLFCRVKRPYAIIPTKYIVREKIKRKNAHRSSQVPVPPLMQFFFSLHFFSVWVQFMQKW